MKKYLIRFSILFFLLPLTGCFEIIEEVNLNDDGSGSIMLTVNLSQSKTKISSLLTMDSINGYKIPSKTDITNHLHEVAKVIQSTPGITNVKKEIDFENYIFSVQCSFDDVSSLNEVTERINKMNPSKIMVSNGTEYFNFNRQQRCYTRNGSYNFSKLYDKLKKADKDVFESAYVVSIIRFKSNVTLITNPDAKLAPTKKAVMIRQNARDLIKETKTITNSIHLAKP